MKCTKTYEVDYNKVYDSISGKFVFLPDTLTVGTTVTKINVMFLYTGLIKNVNIEKALTGNIEDTLLKYMDKIFYSNMGEPIKILRFSHRDSHGDIHVIFKFMIYEYETCMALKNVINGPRNPFYPTLFGVGYFGLAGEHLPKHFTCWHNMISRCYNTEDARYKTYGGIGISVCERWHSFANFLEDIKRLPNYDIWVSTTNKYELDKDTLQKHIPKNERIYSPSTCIFISKIENTNQRTIDNAKSYIGVVKTKRNTFKAYIRVNTTRYHLGSYTSAEAAANAYNLFVIQNGLNRPLNNVRPMTIDELNSYLTEKNENRIKINYIEFAKLV